MEARSSQREFDYRITYTGNKAVTTEDGTYFTVTGTGNYTGSKDVHFVITAKGSQGM